MNNNNKVILLSQLSISIIGIVFSGAMIIYQPQNVNIYVPLFTSIIFTWIPSPMQKIKLEEDDIQQFISNSFNKNNIKNDEV
jgi:hypothetical protein